MTENEVPLLLDDEFLITFTGVVLGIASTIVTFIFSSTDKVLNVLENTYATSEITSDVFDTIEKLIFLRAARNHSRCPSLCLWHTIIGFYTFLENALTSSCSANCIFATKPL